MDMETVPLDQLRAMAGLLPPDLNSPALASTENRVIATSSGDRAVSIYRPVGEGPRPTMVFIHGGGWIVGSPEAVAPVSSRLAAYLGAVVVSISYRLAPENRFPAAFEDAVLLTRWAAEHIAELGGRPNAFAVAGESAGGNLAAATALALRGEGLLAGQLLLNPATDLSSEGKATASFQADADPALTAANADFSMRSYLGAEASTDWRASPASANDFSGVAPAVIGVSGYDPLRDDGIAYATKLKAAGVPAEVICFDDLIHAYAAQSFLVPACNEALVKTCDQFRQLMGWPTP